ncbi:hypothetical protein [Streptomyces sp. NPDC058108]|uniref:hypothetical protein n=1 Tax=Streptomyces sp. NPDC058108 TaxID=3346344 RepID=UPI0036EECBE7
MSAVAEGRRLEDLEEDSLAAVELEWQRRAKGAKPWTTTEYLDRVAAVHARYANFRRWRERQVAR